jgi:hypothetical protein
MFFKIKKTTPVLCIAATLCVPAVSHAGLFAAAKFLLN